MSVLHRFSVCRAGVKRLLIHFVADGGHIIPFDTCNMFQRPGVANLEREGPMSYGQIETLIFAILLLLPGGGCLIVGVASISAHHMGDLAPLQIIVGVLVLSAAGLLFWAAFHGRTPADREP